MKIFLKSEEEIQLMREANRLVGKTLAELYKHIRPGVTTKQLDDVAEEFIRDCGAEPTFKNFPNPFGPPFPASICTSVNSCVVHGIPSDKQVLCDGDIISVDCGVSLNGFCGDSAYTFCVGEVADEVRHLLSVTKVSLYKAIEVARSGNRVGLIGNTVQKFCESHGYGIVRELTGHGIGREMHEDPPVPNYGNPNDGPILKNGMCIAIEPMVTMGRHNIGLHPDKWSILTLDNKPAAHFEHTIVVRHGQSEILSTFEDIEKLEGEIY